ncbi:hypothetical protein Cgig2_029416 [Carnegiea gigantea]|uniref:Uncharacterized protein n=1 Tax=Carnegiea gigantea TaxID=171969 RepID=A0A9Q1GU58_9CARY|nr:hypothetical protein Cgig2_029416 [Carnegiea gigantea]
MKPGRERERRSAYIIACAITAAAHTSQDIKKKRQNDCLAMSKLLSKLGSRNVRSPWLSDLLQLFTHSYTTLFGRDEFPEHMIREEGGFEIRRQTVDSIITLIRESQMQMKVLKYQRRYDPSKYVEYIYNRVIILDNASVRASALIHIGKIWCHGRFIEGTQKSVMKLVSNASFLVCARFLCCEVVFTEQPSFWSKMKTPSKREDSCGMFSYMEKPLDDGKSIKVLKEFAFKLVGVYPFEISRS